MVAVLFRIGLIAAGMGAVEIGLGWALVGGSALGWLLVLVGLPLIVAGSAGFMAPLLGGSIAKGSEDA